jgi:predicted SAM-dependent methyltransferase
MSDKRRRLASWIRGDGIEIGGLHRPLEVPDGARVRYVDLHPADELRELHPELGDVPLVPVTIIGSATDLGSVGDGEVDFVIANHLIEHIEAPIAALLEWHRVLRPGGILFMAVPDGRVTFDRARPMTSASHLIDEFRHGVESTRADHYREYVTLAETQPEVVEIVGVCDDVEARVDWMVKTGFSAHFHVWRPENFLEFLVLAQREASLDFDIVAVAACEPGVDDEFIVVLSKGNATPPPPPGCPWGAALPSAGATAVEASAGIAAPTEEAALAATPPPAPSAYRRVRARLARGRTGDLLRPLYHRAARLRRRLRFARHGR